MSMAVSMVRFSVPVNNYGTEFCMSTIGERLKEERERLRMTIPQFADAAGAKKNTVIDWQKDVSSPPGARLAALAEIGVDVNYVLTGVRRSVYEVIRDDIVKAKKELGMDFIGEKPLTEYDLRTKAFIDEFAALDDSGKEAVEAMIKALSKKTGKEGQ